MKNLMIFVDPIMDFNPEHKVLVQIQIDNSLDLDWKPDDIMLVTNFPYEYRGIISIMVRGDCYYPYFNRATKIPVINRLFEDGLITDVTWFHDFDAFQLYPMPEMDTDFAVTMYNHNGKFKWNAGSFFFKDASQSFDRIEESMWHRRIDEEDALPDLVKQGEVNVDRLDVRYNIHIYDFDANCRVANKPILVAHFHPRKPRHMRLFDGIVPERLKTIFRSHGIDA